MRGRIRNLWENLTTRLWFVPTTLILCAVLLAPFLVEVDVWLAAHERAVIPWLFSGTADAARTVLSVIAGSLVTVISIAFSITIVALTQVSAQYSSRVLNQFTASRSNQIVLGAYTATFAYTLLVLRTVRSNTDERSRFVPALSVTVAIALALICLGLLIYFIHHMSQALQVSTIIDGIRRDLRYQIDRLFPARIGEPIDDAPPASKPVAQLDRSGKPQYICSRNAGFVRRIDEDALRRLSAANVSCVRFRPQLGQFVAEGDILAELDGRDDAGTEVPRRIHDAFVLDRERSAAQDVRFGIRQLVDIALKALSPGVNDSTTAEYVLVHLEDALAQLGEREFPSTRRITDDGKILLIFSRPTWSDLVDVAFSQIRRASIDNVHVTGTLLEVIRSLALRLRVAERGEELQKQVAAIRRGIEAQDFDLEDRRLLYEEVAAVERRLRERSPSGAPAR